MSARKKRSGGITLKQWENEDFGDKTSNPAAPSRIGMQQAKREGRIIQVALHVRLPGPCDQSIFSAAPMGRVGPEHQRAVGDLVYNDADCTDVVARQVHRELQTQRIGVPIVIQGARYRAVIIKPGNG